MDALFNLCVNILIWIGHATGLGYNAANIWIFVIIHPLITIIAILMAIYYRKKYYEK